MQLETKNNYNICICDVKFLLSLSLQLDLLLAGKPDLLSWNWTSRCPNLKPKLCVMGKCSETTAHELLGQ